jgi:hypothetical protein
VRDTDASSDAVPEGSRSLTGPISLEDCPTRFRPFSTVSVCSRGWPGPHGFGAIGLVKEGTVRRTVSGRSVSKALARQDESRGRSPAHPRLTLAFNRDEEAAHRQPESYGRGKQAASRRAARPSLALCDGPCPIGRSVSAHPASRISCDLAQPSAGRRVSTDRGRPLSFGSRTAGRLKGHPGKALPGTPSAS